MAAAKTVLKSNEGGRVISRTVEGGDTLSIGVELRFDDFITRDAVHVEADYNSARVFANEREISVDAKKPRNSGILYLGTEKHQKEFSVDLELVPDKKE